MATALPPAHHPWSRSWFTWLLTNILGSAGTLIFALATGHTFRYAAFVSGLSLIGSLLFVPVIRVALSSVLPIKQQGWRLLAVAGATLSAFLCLCVLLVGFGGFFGLIALLTGWPYFPAALGSIILVHKDLLFRGSD